VALTEIPFAQGQSVAGLLPLDRREAGGKLVRILLDGRSELAASVRDEVISSGECAEQARSLCVLRQSAVDRYVSLSSALVMLHALRRVHKYSENVIHMNASDTSFNSL
jgi:hypothetical protein